MKKLVIKNFWLKILAFLLAVMLWFYIAAELDKGAPDGRTLFEKKEAIR